MSRKNRSVPHHSLVRYRPEPQNPDEQRGRRRVGDRRALLAALGAAVVATAASCANSDGAADPSATEQGSGTASRSTPPENGPNPSAPSGRAPTSNPATTAPAATPTTAAPKTILSPNPIVPTTVPLPQPIAVPLDQNATEPVVEIGRVEIPTIGVDATLFEGIRLPTFDLGPGHWPGTAMPGDIGNMVIGGHRTVGNADFRRLEQIQPDDELIVTDTNGTPHTYHADRTEITDPFAARIIYQTRQRTATLFACHPPGSIARRIVVHFELRA